MRGTRDWPAASNANSHCGTCSTAAVCRRPASRRRPRRDCPARPGPVRAQPVEELAGERRTGRGGHRPVGLPRSRASRPVSSVSSRAPSPRVTRRTTRNHAAVNADQSSAPPAAATWVRRVRASCRAAAAIGPARWCSGSPVSSTASLNRRRSGRSAASEISTVRLEPRERRALLAGRRGVGIRGGVEHVVHVAVVEQQDDPPHRKAEGQRHRSVAPAQALQGTDEAAVGVDPLPRLRPGADDDHAAGDERGQDGGDGVRCSGTDAVTGRRWAIRASRVRLHHPYPVPLRQPVTGIAGYSSERVSTSRVIRSRAAHSAVRSWRTSHSCRCPLVAWPT